METNGEPRRIQISGTTKTLLDLTEAGTFVTKARGPIHIKGKGFVETFWLLGRRFAREKIKRQEETFRNETNDIDEELDDSLDVMHDIQKSTVSSTSSGLKDEEDVSHI